MHITWQNYITGPSKMNPDCLSYINPHNKMHGHEINNNRLLTNIKCVFTTDKHIHSCHMPIGALIHLLIRTYILTPQRPAEKQQQ